MSIVEHIAINAYIGMVDHAELFRVRDIEEVLTLVDNIHYGIPLTKGELKRLQYYASLVDSKIR